MTERTSITVAHRFSTIKDCDRIYALENGRNKDVGTFDELRQRGVIYE
jgi:ABC-type multidrug transport system fused ATPase/permease subunit